MTRPQGKLLKASSVNDLEDQTLMSPEKTIKYKIYNYIKQSTHSCTASQVHLAVAKDSPRRTVEKRLLDLYNQGLINRHSCECGCAFIYSS